MMSILVVLAGGIALCGSYYTVNFRERIELSSNTGPGRYLKTSCYFFTDVNKKQYCADFIFFVQQINWFT
jgi:hypothetical protein